LAVRIRLTRVGATKRPAYRVIAIDKRRSRDGRALEILGFYDPLTDPATVNIDTDRINAWIGKGAQPSETVVKLMRQAAEPPRPAAAEKPKRATRSAKPKASAKAAKAAANEAEAPAAAATEADTATAEVEAPVAEASVTDAAAADVAATPDEAPAAAKPPATDEAAESEKADS
jgi:small subunit ribosomal protein S16